MPMNLLMRHSCYRIDWEGGGKGMAHATVFWKVWIIAHYDVELGYRHCCMTYLHLSICQTSQALLLYLQ